MSVPDPPVLDAVAATATSAEVQSVWDLMTKGGVMMIPLGICSLVAMTVLVERLLSLRRRRVVPPPLVEGLESRPGDAEDLCRAHPSPLARVVRAGLRRAGDPPDAVRRRVEEIGRREIHTLRRNLRVLSVVAAVAPLMGLLGTIFGMIQAFQTVATSADALGKTELLAEGIYQAMITTAAGLCVAIPALICYHWLSARVHGLVLEIDRVAVDFFDGATEGAADADAREAPAGESDLDAMPAGAPA